MLIFRIEEYDDIFVLVKFETNWMVKFREHSHTGTQHMSITPSFDLKPNRWIRIV